jgi:amino acid adenylation domain-containing protein
VRLDRVLAAAVHVLVARQAQVERVSSDMFPAMVPPDVGWQPWPLVSDLSGDPTFSEVVAALGIGAAGDAAVPGWRGPIDCVLRVIVPSDWVAGRSPGADGGWVVRFTGDERRGLEAEVYDEEGGGAAPVNVDVFRRLPALLVAALATPDVPVSRLPLLTDDERTRLLVEWNATVVPLPDSATVHGMFEAQVARRPDAVAVACKGRSLSFAELNGRSNRLAHYLRSLGVGPGALVAVCMDRSEAMVAAILAVLKAGGAYVPLDPDYPRDRLSMMLDDAGRPILLTQRGVGDTLHAGASRVVVLDDPATADAVSTMPADNPTPRSGPTDLAYVIYTSGSTGKPKGVQIVHRNVVNMVLAMRRTPGITDDDAVLALATVCFDMSVLELFLPLTSGAKMVVAPRAVQKEGVGLRRYVEESGVTLIQATPATYRMLIAVGWQGGPHVKVLCGGELVSRGLVEQLLARAGEVWHMYGPTETCVWSTAHRVSPDETGPLSVGRPIDNTQVYILDRQRQPVPPGTVGELYIGGAGVARGYLNRPGLTAERFVPSPFGGGADATLYKTGDLARYRADGSIDFLGRNDDQVKIRGFRIELGEIEEVLARQPGVRQAAVVAVARDGGDARLVAYVVPGDPVVAADPSPLRDRLKAILPDYMIPAAIVPLEAMPLGQTGKVDRGALAAMAPGAFATAAAAVPREFQPPADDVEVKLAAIWRDLLKVERVGVTDDFFEIGGDSLMAVDLAVRVEQEFGRFVPLTAMQPAPTIRRLADVLRGAGPAAAGPEAILAPLRGTGTRPPLFCIPGSGGHVFMYRELTDRLGPEQPVYGLNLPGTDGREAVECRVERIAARFIDEVRKVQPVGPYRLAGYSFGGLVAYEMARQLKEAGRETAIVILFDAFGPGFPRVHPLSVRLLEHVAAWARLPWRDKGKYFAERVRNLGARWTAWSRRRRRRRAYTEGDGVAPSPGAGVGGRTVVSSLLNEVRSSAIAAEEEYAFPAYDGPVTLVRADVMPRFLGMSFDDPSNGWDTIVPGISVCHLPCDHLQMFKGEMVTRAAAFVGEVLSDSDPVARL